MEVDKPGWRFDETPLDKLVLYEMATWQNDIAPIFNILLQKLTKKIGWLIVRHDTQHYGILQNHTQYWTFPFS